ncbi:MAG: hypothetical protein AB7F88_13145 [Pyrinomonadaceae bacterium]
MKITRRVTIEVDRVKITVPRSAEWPSWCEICQAASEFLEPEDAAKLVLALSPPEMTRPETDLHFYHRPHSRPLTCLNSIIQAGGRSKTSVRRLADSGLTIRDSPAANDPEEDQ